MLAQKANVRGGLGLLIYLPCIGLRLLRFCPFVSKINWKLLHILSTFLRYLVILSLVSNLATTWTLRTILSPLFGIFFARIAHRTCVDVLPPPLLSLVDDRAVAFLRCVCCLLHIYMPSLTIRAS